MTENINNKNFPTNQKELLDYFDKLGFCTTKERRLCKNLEEIYDYFNYMSEIRHSLNYDIDGVVYKVNDIIIMAKVNKFRGPPFAVAF